MNIENIEAFVYILHFGSFKKAAAALFLSQSTVTARIQTLEADLKCKLLERKGKQINLTDKGRQFLPHAQQILQSYQVGKLQLQQKPVPNQLKLGCTTTISNYFLPDVLPAFKLKFPHVKISVTTKPSDYIVDKVLEQEIDIGFVRNIFHPHLDSFRCSIDPISLYVPAGHPFIADKPVSLEAVSQQPLIFLQCGSLDWVSLHRMFETLEHPPNIVFRVDNIELLKQLVLQGMGIGFLPEICVGQEVSEGKLFRIDLFDPPNYSLDTNIVAVKGTNTAFVEAFRTISKELRTRRTPLAKT